MANFKELALELRPKEEIQGLAKAFFPKSKNPFVDASYSVILALQYTRYILGQGLIDEEQSYGRYAEALQRIVNLFGEDNFATAGKILFDRDLNSLDFFTSVAERENNGNLHRMHSDISAINPVVFDFAYNCLGRLYHIDNSRYGSYVSTRTLFGDPDFWKFLGENNPSLFQNLLTHVRDWPTELDIANMYMSLSVNPRSVLAKYFPDAYAQIRKIDPSFEADKTKAILGINMTIFEYIDDTRSPFGERNTCNKQRILERRELKYKSIVNHLIGFICFKYNSIFSIYEMNIRKAPLTFSEVLNREDKSAYYYINSATRPYVENIISGLDPLEKYIFMKHLNQTSLRDLALPEIDPSQIKPGDLPELVLPIVRELIEGIISKIPYRD